MRKIESAHDGVTTPLEHADAARQRVAGDEPVRPAPPPAPDFKVLDTKASPLGLLRRSAPNYRRSLFRR